jgi:hypothetical protein
MARQAETTGSQHIPSPPDQPDLLFSFYDGDETSPRMLARNAGVRVSAGTDGYQKPGELDGAGFRTDRFDQLLDLLR